jgi:hypothetical protein
MDRHDQRTDAQHADARQQAEAQNRQAAIPEKLSRGPMHKLPHARAGTFNAHSSWRKNAKTPPPEKYFKAVVPKVPY